MREGTRLRLLSGLRVSLLIIDELRLAQKEGRLCRAEPMRDAAEWAENALRDLVLSYYDRQRRRAGYR